MSWRLEPGSDSRDEVAQLRRELGTVSRQAAHLEQALGTDRRIGVAVGVVVERHEVVADDAFDVLVRLSACHATGPCVLSSAPRRWRCRR